MEQYRKVQEGTAYCGFSDPDLSHAISARQKLEIQLQENDAVQKVRVSNNFSSQELEACESTENVFKLNCGILFPVLICEAKENVSKRLEFITAEAKKSDQQICKLEKRRDELEAQMEMERNANK
ncbi:hypothetical protein DI09_19p120 [Mitosporidium daphniae]|uniref:Uncharacterized protein n=1 Tax=Mitosporidium daphniae TaxID=1485682 RepID=A0A098VTD2_9MICR|nr:uncharacterized protein DI09_19p120 [Mitosporidium daphniae]KGG52230.1 hypothetical protein DI09_19p120 [Mitosporidium daphniae]|eukprot:XP_013238657.1 uncharacterized protein DI09_19p120 [Mitosporidium daphniae]